MPRPRKRRRLGPPPPAVFYKPQGVPLHALRGVALRAEWFEALKLVDADGLSQEAAAEQMHVSRPTLCRILGEARHAVARALVNGWAIRIETEQDEHADEGQPQRGPGRCGRTDRACGHGKNARTNEEES